MGFGVSTKPDTGTYPKLSEDSSDTHFHCCINENVSLCGFDISDYQDVEALDETGCIVCDDLVDTAHCPVLGDDECIEV